jgi:hypothetical protein
MCSRKVSSLTLGSPTLTTPRSVAASRAVPSGVSQVA